MKVTQPKLLIREARVLYQKPWLLTFVPSDLLSSGFGVDTGNEMCRLLAVVAKTKDTP